MEFAQRLNEMLEEKGVTAYRLSKSLGIHQTTVKNWVDGTSKPRTEFVQKMADFFGVSPDYLMGWSNNRTAQEEDENLSLKDRRDIAKDLNRIMDEIQNDKDGPLYYNGIEIDEESLALLQAAMNMALKQAKMVNKEKYNPNKNRPRKKSPEADI